MRVLFYEPNSGGHHFAYLARMLPGFLELPIEAVLSTTRSAAESQLFELTLRRFGDRLRVDAFDGELPQRNPLKNSRWRYAQLKAAVRRTEPDHVCVLYADGLWELATLEHRLRLGRLPSGPTYEAWLYRGGFAYADANRLIDRARRRLFRALQKSGLFKRIHLDDELAFAFAERTPGSRTDVVLPANPVSMIPPLSHGEARQKLGVPDGGPVVSLSGQISDFKGAHLAIEAIHSARGGQPDNAPRLLLAGPHSDAIRDQLAQPANAELVRTGGVLSIDRFITEEEMFMVAAASDLVVTPYPRHSGRSSILLWAAAAGRQVLAVDRGCIAHVVEKESLGKTCNVIDPEAFGAAITQSLQSPWTEADSKRVRAYASWHSVENYQRMSSDLVRGLCQPSDGADSVKSV